jgi:hypothetical protein
MVYFYSLVHSDGESNQEGQDGSLHQFCGQAHFVGKVVKHMFTGIAGIHGATVQVVQVGGTLC